MHNPLPKPVRSATVRAHETPSNTCRFAPAALRDFRAGGEG